MKDPMAMSEEEYCLFRARGQAAKVYRSEGFDEFAARVERGWEDSSSQVRLARFFLEPPRELCEEFIEAWRAASAF